MELRVLEYFLALTREGSVSRAAEVLHVSQPTLSRQLIDLERELGTTLFERGRHGVTLTEDGMLLRRRATEICELARITEREIMLNRGVVAGEVRIGCAETRAMDLLASLMRDLQADHPQVTFRIVSDLAESVVEKIDHGLLDFGLLLRVRDRWGLGSVRLPTRERAVVVMRPDSPLASLDVVTPEDLTGVPVMIPASYRESGMLGDLRPASEGGTLSVTAEFDLAYNASRMVEAGMGCAVMLEGTLDGREGALVERPLDVALDMPSYFVWKPSQLRTRACEALLGRVRQRYEGADALRPGDAKER